MDPHLYALETASTPYALGIRMVWEMGIRAGTAEPLTDRDRRQKAEGPRMSRMELDAFKGEAE